MFFLLMKMEIKSTHHYFLFTVIGVFEKECQILLGYFPFTSILSHDVRKSYLERKHLASVHEDVSENPTSILFHPPQSRLLLSFSLAVKLLSLSKSYIMTTPELTLNIGRKQF